MIRTLMYHTSFSIVTYLFPLPFSHPYASLDGSYFLVFSPYASRVSPLLVVVVSAYIRGCASPVYKDAHFGPKA